MITLIWAQDKNRAIGANGTIPWRLPEDMKHFKEVTLHSTVIMGRKTWESLPVKHRPLTERKNVVISRNPEYDATGATVYSSVESALQANNQEIMVIGGGEIYAAALPYADRVIVTEVDVEVPNADAFAPKLDPKEWVEVSITDWVTSVSGVRYRIIEMAQLSN